MSFFVENKGSFEPCPAGLHLARCYRLVDMGTQRSEYQGQVKFSRMVMISWEIHGSDDEGNPLLMDNGKPFSIAQWYNLSWAETAKLRKHLQSWRGKPFSQEEMRRFDLKNILGAWCMINVVQTESDGKVKSKLDSIAPVPGAIKTRGFPAGVNDELCFQLSDPNWEIYESLGQNLKAKIAESPEFQKLKKTSTSDYDDSQPVAVDTSDDDEIPF